MTLYWNEIQEARLKMRDAFLEMTSMAREARVPETHIEAVTVKFWDGNEDMNTLLAEMKGAIGDY